ncbi:hypothetical protein PsorP6_010625 [Peronosclerospora sorghi]|uniref:Uncharacterized protein n=1 Tax=Peronosclerospora sorghi TaxID=230839 RepID=A0ACC0VVJ7_9STRA|nr:hypothetical protein PsorP6_010625 [Peronosclerospora sorghi]
MAAMLIKNTLQMSLRVKSGFFNFRAFSNIPSSSFFSASFNPMSVSSVLLMTKPENVVRNPPLDFDISNTRLQVDCFLPQHNQISDIRCPTDCLNVPLQAIKRTYQPSVLRRKRKHGFRSRRVSVSGRKVLNRRFNKGRWRMSL